LIASLDEEFFDGFDDEFYTPLFVKLLDYIDKAHIEEVDEYDRLFTDEEIQWKMDETVQAFEELVQALEGDEFDQLFGDLSTADIEEVAVM
jgi:hypothetical protein